MVNELTNAEMTAALQELGLTVAQATRDQALRMWVIDFESGPPVLVLDTLEPNTPKRITLEVVRAIEGT